MDQQQQNQRFWSGPRLGLINHSAWACSHHDCATYIPQEVGRWALQETLLQGPGEVTLRLNWSHQAVCEPHHRKNSCVWYWVCKFRIFKSHQSLDLKIVMEWKSNKHPGFFNLKLVTSSDPCFTAGLVDHGCDLHRSIQRNLGGRWLHVTWRKWSYSQWFFLHDFKGVHMTVVNKFNLNPRPRDLDGSTWLLSKPFRTRPTDYIQGFSYIYIYIYRIWFQWIYIKQGNCYFALGAGGHHQESRSLQLASCELGSDEAIHQSRDWEWPIYPQFPIRFLDAYIPIHLR